MGTRFRDGALDDYAEDRNRPDKDGTSRMSAHLKFGTIHPRTLAADLDARRKGHAAYLRELAFRDFYASVLYHWPDSAWWNWNRNFDAIDVDTGKAAEEAVRGVEGQAPPAFRSSTRGCVSCAKPASCTTAFG